MEHNVKRITLTSDLTLEKLLIRLSSILDTSQKAFDGKHFIFYWRQITTFLLYAHDIKSSYHGHLVILSNYFDTYDRM